MSSTTHSQSPRFTSMRDKVQVAVRVRPLLKRELRASDKKQPTNWTLSPTCITQYIGNKPVPFHNFCFDQIFLPHSTNESVFENIARPVVASAIDGINGVIFAYGQTAAGKTHTMLGNEDDPGVTLRSVSDVFERISKLPHRRFFLKASYIEIYNECIRDLLVPSNDNLKIHVDVISNNVFVNSHRKVVTSEKDVVKIISAGEAVRAIGATNMNEKASRSHTIFTISIESREIHQSGTGSVQGTGVAVRNSTLSLVDLAGSERASLTKAYGKRLAEGGYINKSLLTLGNVIKKLSSGDLHVHIPYRDSKLTRLLQPALGGNARTVIICAVTTAVMHTEETLSTLKFASRAKQVTNHAETNEFLDDRAKLIRAEKQIKSLRKEMQALRRLMETNCIHKTVQVDETQAQARQSWQIQVERSVSDLISVVQKMKGECPRCLTSKSIEDIQVKEKIMHLKKLLKRSPKQMKCRHDNEAFETMSIQFDEVKKFPQKFKESDTERAGFKKTVEDNSNFFHDQISECEETDFEQSVSACSSDDFAKDSIDLNTSLVSSSEIQSCRAKLQENVQDDYEEKRETREGLLSNFSSVWMKLETKERDAALSSEKEMEYLVDPDKNREKKEYQTEQRTDLNQREQKADKHSGKENDESRVVTEKSRILNVARVMGRVLMASCAIWLHCNISKLLCFGSDQAFVGTCTNTVSECFLLK